MGVGLLEQTGADRLVVTNSGLLAPADVVAMRRHQVNTILVEGLFIRAPAPGQALAWFSGDQVGLGLMQTFFGGVAAAISTAAATVTASTI